MSDHFQGTDHIELQPNDQNIPVRMKFKAASASTKNDGSMPYGSTVASVISSMVDGNEAIRAVELFDSTSESILFEAYKTGDNQLVGSKQLSEQGCSPAPTNDKNQKQACDRDLHVQPTGRLTLIFTLGGHFFKMIERSDSILKFRIPQSAFKIISLSSKPSKKGRPCIPDKLLDLRRHSYQQLHDHRKSDKRTD